MASKIINEEDVTVVHAEASGPVEGDGKPLPEVYVSRMAQALLEESPNPWRASFLKLYSCIFVGYLCSATSGFDANTFGGLSAIPSFIDFFGITPDNQGLVAALYVVGQAFGALIAGPCSDRYGRRVGMAIGSLVCCVAVALQTAAKNIQMLEGGRVLLGLGSAIVGVGGLSYVVEMAYPLYRGRLTGGYNACFFLGTIVSTWLEYGLYFIQTDSSFIWRVPLAVQAVPSICILSSVWFIPETPRWLLAHDRSEDARAVLVKYHGDGQPDSPVVQVELDEMKAVISINASDKRFWDWRELFNTPSARYRTFLVTCVAWFSELDLPPTSYYLPLMAKTAGITSTSTQLLLNALQTPIMMAAALCGLRFVDRWGRRPLLMTSSTGMTISVAVITACTAMQDGRPTVGATGVAFIYVFLVVFAFAWTPAQSLYPSEILTYATRGKGLAYRGLMGNLISVINTYAPPVAIAKGGWRFYLLYVIWDAFGVVVIYFCFVETRGRSLEELDVLFEAKNPVKESLKLKPVETARQGSDDEAGCHDI